MAGKSNEKLTVQVQIVSTGQTYFGRVEVYFYASTDASITASDTYLGRASVLLGGGERATLTWIGMLPASLPQGAYYIGWRIDPGDQITEADETNNTAYKRTLLLNVGPFQPTIYVDANAHGANNGSNWKNAFARLQDALTMAEPGWEIRVADGTYTPDQGIGITARDREASFKLSGGITIRGGYSGDGAPDPNARNIQTYATVLSGDLKANDLPVADPCNLWKEASRTDNSRHILTVTSKDQTATLDGVQVAGGYAFGPSAATTVASDLQGAGLIVSGGSLNLRNCTFSDNWASGDGGAIYVADGRLDLVDCTFRANGAGTRVSQPRGTGGAIRSDGNSQMTLSGCKFLSNFAGAQGGAFDNNKGSAALTRCLFLRNVAVSSGGGALWNSEGRLNAVSCTFNGNRSDSSGGAIVNGWSGSLSAANCSLHANYSKVQAGAIDNCFGGKAALWNCTLAANRQDGGLGAIVCGPALGLAGSELTIANCILWDGGSEIANQGKSLVTVGRSNVQGGWPGVGNLNADPLFAQAAGVDGIAGTEDDNLRLGVGSPGIDHGDSALLPQDFADLDGDGDLKEPVPLDLDGKQRVTGAAVDLGAYEVQQPSSSSSAPSCSCSGG
jgi:predicted outer membrane repeat protein